MCEKTQKTGKLCEDILEVVGLPLEVPHSESSTFIGEYISKTYQQHENSKQKILSEINDVNTIVDENTRQCTYLFKEEMRLMRSKYYPNISDIQSTDQWPAVREEQNKRRKEINSLISEYISDMKDLEQNRSEKIVKILRNYKEEAVKLRLCSPDETYRILEEAIVGFNLKVLNNVRQHEDFKLQLQVEGQQLEDECFQYLKNKASHLAENRALQLWNKIKDKQNQRLVVDTIFNLTQENLKAREGISQATSNLVVGLSEFAEILQIPADFEIDEEFWKHWIGMLNSRLESFESLCQRVHILLKTAVASLLEKFDVKINSLTRTLYPSVGAISESGCIINKGSDENTIQLLKNEQAKELELIFGNWQEIIGALNKKINQSKAFVSDLTFIWTNHMNRRKELQDNLEIELENLRKKWLKEESKMNSKIKRQIKAVREAKDLPKLNYLNKSLENTLFDLTAKLEDNYETQLQKVEEVRQNGIEPMIERKVAEIKEFLMVKYPKIHWLDEKFSLQLKTSGDDLDNQIEMCNTYMKSVDNRTLGMYEMLERYLPMCPIAIRGESDDWLYIFIQDIITSFETQLEEIKERHETTLQALKQLRSAELQIHSDRLLSHSSGIKCVLSNLNKRYEETKSHINSQITDFNEKIQNISVNKNNLSTSKQIEDSISKMNYDWMTISKSLVDRIFEAKAFCSNEINSINNSNSMFCQIAKTFKNGGNYSTEELKLLKKEINQLKKLILNYNKTLSNNYNKLSKCISSTVFDTAINELKEKHDKLKLEEDLNSFLDTIRFRLRTCASNLRAMGDAIDRNIANINLDNDNVEDLVKLITEMSKKRLHYLVPSNEFLTEECFSSVDKTTPSTPSNTTQVISDTYKSFLMEAKEYILNQYSDMENRIQNAMKANPPKPTKRNNFKKSKSINQGEYEQYDEKRNQLKSILLNYYNECKYVCIQESQKHLDQMNCTQTIINELIKQQFNNVHKAYIHQLNSLENWYGKVIAKEYELEEIHRHKIKNNLIILLAHPNQTQRLNKLFQEAKDSSKFQNITELLGIYKRKLQKMHDEYAEQIIILRRKLENIQSIVFNTECSKTNLLITTPPHNNSGQELECNINETTSKIYPLSIRPENESILTNVSLAQFHSIRNFQEVRTDTHTLGNVSIVDLATENLKDSVERIQNKYDEARYKAKRYEETVKKWLQLFECDMIQAKLIYSSV